MNKKFTTSAFLIASASVGLSQGLYDLATFQDNAYDNKFQTLNYTAGLNFTYDDNVVPLAATEDSSVSVEAFVRAQKSYTDSERTAWSAFLQLGYLYYFDDVTGASDDSYTTIRAGFSLNHQVDERLRFVSTNSYTRALEPDYSVGITNSRAQEEYTTIVTDQSVGYRWSTRFATYTGVAATIIDYASANNNLDREIYSVYNNFRYQVSAQTVATLNYRYSSTEGNSASDSTNQYISVGAEHRFSPTSIAVIKVGAQIRDVDGGEDGTSPFIEGAIRNRVNQKLSVRGFVRYSAEDFQTNAVAGSIYDTVETLRLGLSSNYKVNGYLTLHGGVDVVITDYGDLRPGGVVPEFDEDLINLSLGFTYAYSNDIAFTGGVNFTDVDSGAVGRDYDRSRFNLGVRTQF